MRLLRRLWHLLRHSKVDADLREEIEAHRQMREDHLLRSGMPAADAARDSRRAIGNVVLAREDARAVWSFRHVDDAWRDVRYALRGLASHPSFTWPALGVLVVTMTLAMSLFVFVDTMLLKPWALPDASRLVTIESELPVADFVRLGAPVALHQHLRQQATSLDVVAFDPMQLSIGAAGTATRPGSFVRFVSGNYFSTLRLPLIAGRGLSTEDERDAGSATAVISASVWRDLFAGATSVVGAKLLVDGQPFTVVGVAKDGATDNPFDFPPQAWLTLTSRQVFWADDHDVQQLFGEANGCCVQLAGRLAPGATIAAANQEVARLASAFADDHGVKPARLLVTGTSGAAQQRIWERVRVPLAVLTLAVALVLLLGCANAGNLHLARGLARRREIAIRVALGATRAQIVRLMLCEAGLLCGAAAAIALFPGTTLPFLVLGATARMPEFSWRLGPALLCAIVLALGCVLMSALVPTMTVSNLAQASAARRVSSRLRLGLLTIQVAITAVLLIGSALLARGTYQLAIGGLGFDPYGLSVVHFGWPDSMPRPERQQALSAIVDAARAAGVTSVAGSSSVPFGGYNASYAIRRVGDATMAPQRAVTLRVTPSYFDVLRMRFTAGGPFGDSGSTAVVINERFAQALWPGESGLGRTFLDGAIEKRVVGVIADAHAELVDVVSPTYYERGSDLPSLLVRGPAANTALLVSMVQRVEPRASPVVASALPRLLQQLNPTLVGTTLAMSVAMVALLLAAIGTFGVFSYLVNERTREIGIRLALGAARRDVVITLAAGLARPLAAGLVIGLVLAQSLGGILTRYLHGISARDPIAYAVVLITLVGAGILALAGPARRALRVNPAVTLRAD